jgi:hypothetical protein
LTAQLGDAALQTVVGKVRVGNAGVDLLRILDRILTQLQAETHNAAGVPTTVPLNAALYLAEQMVLAGIKS